MQKDIGPSKDNFFHFQVLLPEFETIFVSISVKTEMFLKIF